MRTKYPKILVSRYWYATPHLHGDFIQYRTSIPLNIGPHTGIIRV